MQVLGGTPCLAIPSFCCYMRHFKIFLQNFTLALPSFDVCVCFFISKNAAPCKPSFMLFWTWRSWFNKPDPSNIECLLLAEGIRSCCHSVMRRSDAVLLSTLLLSVWTRVFTIGVKGLNSQFTYMDNIQLYSFNFKFCVMCISDPSAAARRAARWPCAATPPLALGDCSLLETVPSTSRDT